MQKDFIVDTNALLENPDTIEILRNGKDDKDINRIFIPLQVVEELDKLKRDARLRPIVMRAIKSLNENRKNVTIIRNGDIPHTPDNQIIKEIETNKHKFDNPIFVSNDKLLQFKVLNALEIPVEEFKASIPFESESEQWTGFAENRDSVKVNEFFFEEGKIHFKEKEGEIQLGWVYNPWNTVPRNEYQNCGLHLMLHPHIDLVTIQSKAGLGKTYLALSAALEMVIKEKRYEKIYIFKNAVEIGPSLGFLPGDIEEKMEPYTKYIFTLLEKLKTQRDGNKKIFLENGKVNPAKIEILPLSFIRGMNIENAVVIVDEIQNLSRLEARSLLTRMCDDVKCICVGDTNQVDNQHLSSQNNALNWICKKMRGHSKYAHLVLKGSKSRGPITDMVLERGL